MCAYIRVQAHAHLEAHVPESATIRYLRDALIGILVGIRNFHQTMSSLILAHRWIQYPRDVEMDRDYGWWQMMSQEGANELMEVTLDDGHETTLLHAWCNNVEKVNKLRQFIKNCVWGEPEICKKCTQTWVTKYTKTKKAKVHMVEKRTHQYMDTSLSTQQHETVSWMIQTSFTQSCTILMTRLFLSRFIIFQDGDAASLYSGWHGFIN